MTDWAGLSLSCGHVTDVAAEAVVRAFSVFEGAAAVRARSKRQQHEVLAKVSGQGLRERRKKSPALGKKSSGGSRMRVVRGLEEETIRRRVVGVGVTVMVCGITKN